MSNKLTFDIVNKRFIEKECKLLIETEEEFNKIYQDTKKTKLKYIAQCGHERITSYQNFIRYTTGCIYCKTCTNKNTSIKNILSKENKLNNINIEYKAIQYLISFMNEKFDVIKAFDACKADLIFKPKNVIFDKWLGIQIKSTNKKQDNRNSYQFRFHKNDYIDYIICCICVNDNKIWIFDTIQHKGTIAISPKSKYNKFEVFPNDIINKLSVLYENNKKFTFNSLNRPTSKGQQQEQKYKKLRESKIDFIKFINNDIECQVYDFKIGDKKVQEKVASLRENKTSYRIYLKKMNGRNKYQCYEKGDNDFYWFHLVNNSIFYVVPENILLEKNLIGRADKKDTAPTISSTSNTWLNEYKFDYNNIDKTKLKLVIKT